MLKMFLMQPKPFWSHQYRLIFSLRQNQLKSCIMVLLYIISQQYFFFFFLKKDHVSLLGLSGPDSYFVLFPRLMFTIIIIIIIINWLIGIMVRVFPNGLEDQGSILGWVIWKTQKMVLVASLLNTQHYKV